MKIITIVLVLVTVLFLAVFIRSPVQLWILDRLARCWGKRRGYTSVVAGGRSVSVQYRWAPRFTRLIDVVTGKRKRGISTRAITVARTILFRDEPPWPADLQRHEKVHVRQWVERGWYAASAAAELEAEDAERGGHA